MSDDLEHVPRFSLPTRHFKVRPPLFEKPGGCERLNTDGSFEPWPCINFKTKRFEVRPLFSSSTTMKEQTSKPPITVDLKPLPVVNLTADQVGVRFLCISFCEDESAHSHAADGN